MWFLIGTEISPMEKCMTKIGCYQAIGIDGNLYNKSRRSARVRKNEAAIAQQKLTAHRKLRERRI